MGRIQRKKTAKKKKKDSAYQSESPDLTGDAAVVSTVASPSAEKKDKKVEKKKTVPAVRPVPSAPKENFVTKSVQFLREVKVELKKVTWPSRKQTVGSTVVVVILVSVIAFFLGAVDIGLSSLVKVVLR